MARMSCRHYRPRAYLQLASSRDWSCEPNVELTRCDACRLNPATAFTDLLPTRRQVTSASTEGQVAWFLACVASEDNSESTRKTMAQLLSSIAPFLPFEVVKTFIMAVRRQALALVQSWTHVPWPQSVNDDRLRNVSMAGVYEMLTQEELVQLRFALATAGMPAANAPTLIDALATKITAKYSKAVQDNGDLPVDAQLDELQELADTLPDNYEWQTTVLYNRLLRVEATTGSLATDMPLLQRYVCTRGSIKACQSHLLFCWLQLSFRSGSVDWLLRASRWRSLDAIPGFTRVVIPAVQPHPRHHWACTNGCCASRW